MGICGLWLPVWEVETHMLLDYIEAKRSELVLYIPLLIICCPAFERLSPGRWPEYYDIKRVLLHEKQGCLYQTCYTAGYLGIWVFVNIFSAWLFLEAATVVMCFYPGILSEAQQGCGLLSVTNLFYRCSLLACSRLFIPIQVSFKTVCDHGEIVIKQCLLRVVSPHVSHNIGSVVLLNVPYVNAADIVQNSCYVFVQQSENNYKDVRMAKVRSKCRTVVCTTPGWPSAVQLMAVFAIRFFGPGIAYILCLFISISELDSLGDMECLKSETCSVVGNNIYGSSHGYSSQKTLRSSTIGMVTKATFHERKESASVYSTNSCFVRMLQSYQLGKLVMNNSWPADPPAYHLCDAKSFLRAYPTCQSNQFKSPVSTKAQTSTAAFIIPVFNSSSKSAQVPQRTQTSTAYTDTSTVFKDSHRDSACGQASP